MAEPRMQVTVAEDGRTAELGFLPASGLSGELSLTQDQVISLMAALATARARMAQVNPEPPMEQQQLKAVVNPRWLTRPEALTEGSLLAFQHPGYGPVGFALPAPEVERLVRALSSHLGMIHSNERQEGSKPS